MATITKSIGTTARDYSTITAWEAALDNTDLYSASDDAVGECYDDSAFDEAVTLNGGSTVGLNSITLTVADGEKHDGTEGTGARLVASTSRVWAFDVPATLSWFEWNGGGYVSRIDAYSGSTSTQTYFKNCLLHDNTDASYHAYGIRLGANRAATVTNNIVYNITCTNTSTRYAAALFLYTTTRYVYSYNNTTWNVISNNGTGVAYGISVADYNCATVKNCIAADLSGSSSGAKYCFYPPSPSAAVMAYNLSSDTTASGTGSLTEKTAANQFVSTTGGSEDLHLKGGADAIGAGTDLGTTPTGVNIDIDGRDRDAEGDTWDMGADQFVAVATGNRRRRFIASLRAA